MGTVVRVLFIAMALKNERGVQLESRYWPDWCRRITTEASIVNARWRAYVRCAVNGATGSTFSARTAGSEAGLRRH